MSPSEAKALLSGHHATLQTIAPGLGDAVRVLIDVPNDVNHSDIISQLRMYANLFSVSPWPDSWEGFAILLRRSADILEETTK